MRRNDCNELFLQAHWLVTCYLRTNGENTHNTNEEDKQKEEKDIGRNDCNDLFSQAHKREKEQTKMRRTNKRMNNKLDAMTAVNCVCRRRGLPPPKKGKVKQQKRGGQTSGGKTNDTQTLQ